MHYFSWHIGDYKAHTHHLTLMEDLAYRRLLELYYLQEKPIVAELAARQIGMREYGQEVLAVLVEFFEETDEGFINKRADAEIARFQSKVEQASKAGKASAERRSNARSTDVQPTNNHKPITNNQVTTCVSHEKIVFDGSSFQQVNGYREKWAEAYPAINVDAEIAKAAAWAMSNPKNRKSNWARFLTNWMSRAQDSAPVAERKERKVEMPWWQTEQGMLEKGREHNTSPRPGEDWAQFKSRLIGLMQREA